MSGNGGKFLSVTYSPRFARLGTQILFCTGSATVHVILCAIDHASFFSFLFHCNHAAFCPFVCVLLANLLIHLIALVTYVLDSLEYSLIPTYSTFLNKKYSYTRKVNCLRQRRVFSLPPPPPPRDSEHEYEANS